MKAMKLKIKSYPPEAKNLVEIFQSYANSSMNEFGIGFVTFQKKRPKNPKNQNRRIAGLKAESISYLGDDMELVKMSAENFIYLMTKFGVDIEITEDE